MKRTAIASVCVMLLWWAGMGCTPKIDVNGNSTATIHVPPNLKFKFKNSGQKPIVLPMPGGGTIEIPPGVEFEIDTGKGGDVTIEDKIKISNQTAQNAKTGTYDGNGTLLAGSTYAFTIPEVFGSNVSSAVPLSGSLSFSAREDAAMPGPGGSKILNPGGIVSLDYHAGGPAPTWTLPLRGTMFGDIDGVGTVTGSPFTVEYNGDVKQLSGVLDGDGVHFKCSFPLTFTMGDTVGSGSETEVGTAVASAVVEAKPLNPLRQ